MIKKANTEGEAGGQANAEFSQFSDTVKESAQQIWLAGLGAFSKALEEGGKVFESLVKEGVAMQRKTQSAAEEKLTEASSRMASMASEISARASGQWDKLEGIFENRVAKAIDKLGVPSSRDIDALAARVDELARSVAKLNAKSGGARRSNAARAAAAPARPAAKRAAPRKSA
jgi:poly(hydroxyalkanoate) granule-associated protein